MFKPVSLYLGLRYTVSRRSDRFISVISVISVLGTALGVAVLIVATAVVHGFEVKMKSTLLGVVPHATMRTYLPLAPWEPIAEAVAREPSVVAVSPYVSGDLMLKRGGQVSWTQLEGVEPALEQQTTRLGELISGGDFSQLRSNTYRVFLGRELAETLKVKVGDRVQGFSATDITRGTPKIVSLQVAGLVNTGLYQFDSRIAVVHLDDARDILQRSGADGLRLRSVDAFEADGFAEKVQRSFPDFRVEPWTARYTTLFRAIAEQRSTIALILYLIVAVAAFNLVSTLVMIVTDKQGNIAILRTMGMRSGSVLGIFVILGLVLGAVGVGLGVALGIVASLNFEGILHWAESLLDRSLFNKEVYDLATLPAILHWPTVSQIALVAIALTIAATIYPAWRATRLAPADSLKYD